MLGELEAFLGEKRRLEDITQGDVEKWMKHLIAEKIEPSSRNRYLGIVKQFCKWWRDELPIPVERDELRTMLQRQRELGHIIYRVERFEEGESSERAVPPETMGKLLRASERKPDHHRAFVLYGYFGFRRNEGRLLGTKDVDFRRNEIHIRRETTKTPSGVRIIPFHPAMSPYLRSDGRYVLGGEEPYSKEFFYTFLRPYDKVAGFHLRVKQFRSSLDTYLSDILQRRLPHRRADLVLKSILGHKRKQKDMSDHYYGEHEEFEADRRRAMREWHPFIEWGIIK